MSRWSEAQLKARAKSAKKYRARSKKKTEIICKKCGKLRKSNKCNACRAVYMKKWRDRQSPEKKAAMTAHSREWARRNGMDRVYNLRYNYNMTVEEYRRLNQVQDGVCAICGKEDTRIDKKTNKRRDDDFAVSGNGATPTTDTSGTLPTVDRIHLGCEVSTLFLNGHIQSLEYFSHRVPNHLLTELSK